jgi:hypothetical protein
MLLDRLGTAIRVRHFSPRTEEAYAGWVRRYIVFHGRRHPDQMGEAEIRDFLSSVDIGVRAKRAERLPVVLTRAIKFGECCQAWRDHLVL